MYTNMRTFECKVKFSNSSLALIHIDAAGIDVARIGKYKNK